MSAHTECCKKNCVIKTEYYNVVLKNLTKVKHNIFITQQNNQVFLEYITSVDRLVSISLSIFTFIH